MQTPLYLRSLCPGTPVYAWQCAGPWECLDPSVPLPGGMFLSNQAGLQVGCHGAVDVDSFCSLLHRLPDIHKDLFLDAVSIVGLRNTRNIHVRRWEKLSNPRPMQTAPQRTSILTLYTARPDGETYVFNCTRKANGGWYPIDAIPDIEYQEEFSMWEYTVYVPPVVIPVTIPAAVAKRLITSIFDNLFCYDLTDASLMSYLVYAQPLMKQLWEGGKNGASKRPG